jgi:hypothetical protein
VARLSAEHTASTGRAISEAVDVAAVVTTGQEDSDKPSTAAQLLAELSEQVAAGLGRHWLISTLVRSVKMDMGEMPIKRSVIKTRADGQTTVRTIEVYQRNSAGVVAGVKLLLDEIERREKAQQTIEHKAAQADGKPERSLGARMIEKAFGKPPPLDEDDGELDEFGDDPEDEPQDPLPPV